MKKTIVNSTVLHKRFVPKKFYRYRKVSRIFKKILLTSGRFFSYPIQSFSIEGKVLLNLIKQAVGSWLPKNDKIIDFKRNIAASSVLMSRRSHWQENEEKMEPII